MESQQPTGHEPAPPRRKRTAVLVVVILAILLIAVGLSLATVGR